MDNPQDLINQALGGNTPTTKAEPATPTLPTPEPISPATTAESPTETTSAASETPTTSVQPVATQQQPAPAMDAVVPTELTNDNGTMTTATAVPDATATEQPVMPEISNVEAKGEDVPLALVGAAPIAADSTTSTTSVVESIGTSVPPALTQTPTTTGAKKSKSKSLKILTLVLGFFVLFGIVGGFAYQLLSGESLVALVSTKKPKEIDNRDDCSGESNGGWLVWRNGECKVTGISGNTDNPDKNTENPNDKKVEEANTKSQCGSAGGVWCDYGFCLSQTSTKGCNAEAIERGYVVTTGANVVSCSGSHASKCTCGNNQDFCFDKTGYCGYEKEGTSDQTKLSSLCSITTSPLWTVDPNCKETNKLNCPAIPTTVSNNGANDGIADWFNKVNKTGNTTYYCANMTENVSVGCNTLAAPPTNLKCFCGTIQVDTPTGFESRTMKCGCDGKTTTTTENPSPSPSGSVSFMCTSIQRTAQANPATGDIPPAMGDKLTFTCAGAATPAGSVSLTYKFRYSINDGAYTSLTNKTATTAEMTIAQCGRYKVQCQACGTINGVLSCDPVWTPATTQ